MDTSTPKTATVLSLVSKDDKAEIEIDIRMVNQIKSILEMVKAGNVDTFSAVLLTKNKEMHSFLIRGSSRFASIGAVDVGYEMILNQLKGGLENE